MSNSVKKITAFMIALIMAAAAALVLIPPVNASAASLIDYSVSYSGNYVKLRFIPRSSSDTIYYTTNNTKPTRSSAVYTKQLAAAAKTTVRAIEYSKSGKQVASLRITIAPRVRKPVITENVIDGKLMLTLESSTSGAKIYYTTDGSTPTKRSKKYTGAFEYERGMNVKARAYASGMKSSAVSTYFLASDEYSAVTGEVEQVSDIFTDADASAETKEVVRLLNEERMNRGIDQLVMDPALNKAADKRAREIADRFAHERPDGSSNFTVLDDYDIDYMAAGENIAGGQTTASSVMNSWMKSSGHRSNILSKDFHRIGVSHIVSDGMDYWVQVFTD